MVGSAITAKKYRDTQDDAETMTAAKLLDDRHGNNAEIVAAQRADALFRDGNTTEGTRCLKISRRIATGTL